MKNKQTNYYTFFSQKSKSKYIFQDINEKNLNTSNIFVKYMKKGLNENLNLNSFNLNKLNDHSKKHFPSATKEWYNSIYTYNKKDMRNIVLKYLIVTKTIKNFINAIPIYLSRRISRKIRVNFKNKIYMSKPEIKHNNRKVVITLYIFADKYLNLTYLSKYLNKENFTFWMYKKTRLLKIKDFIYKEWNNSLSAKNNSRSNKERISKVLYKYKDILIEILNLEKKIDKMKKYFERRISKFFNKTVVIKLIRLKYIYLNSSMVAEYLALKLKKSNLYSSKKKIWSIKSPIFSKIPLNKKKYINEYTVKIISLLDNISNVPLEMVNDKYYNKKINNKKLLTNNYCKEIIKLIKYKYPIGIRLASAGRLTKRYRADRAVYRLFSRGIFKNIDSSINRQSVVLLRGCVRPNLAYSMFCFKRRIGAYSVKSWLSFF